MDCEDGLEYDAGLCYKKCDSGFYGVGPVCWANTPASWIACGMGAAANAQACAETVFDQVTSIGNMALNIATAGASKVASMTKDAAADLKKQFENLKKIANVNEKVQDVITKGQGKFPVTEAGKSTAEILKADLNTVTSEDIVRVSSQISALVDPSGASDVIATYTYPKCSILRL